MLLDNLNQNLDYLIIAIAGNDKHALEELYILVSTKVYAYALSILKNRYDAEDVLQNCFIKIYQSAYSYQANHKALNWIMTITRNLCLEKLRSKRYEIDDLQEDWNTIVDDNDELSVVDKLLVQQCMSILNDEDRMIVVLHAVAGMKHREIANHLDLPLSTVLSKYNRAIKKLKNEFQRELYHEK